MDAQPLQAFDTARLHLRPLDERDEALYCALYTDPELMRHIAPPMTLDAAQRSFRAACKQQSRQKQRWIIHACVGDDTSEAAGLLGLFMEDDSAEIGVMLWPAWQGQGHAGELIYATAERMFAIGDFTALWTRHAPGNNRAVGLMHKLGFRQERDPDVTGQHRWRLSRGDWQAAHGPAALAPGAFRG